MLLLFFCILKIFWYLVRHSIFECSKESFRLTRKLIQICSVARSNSPGQVEPPWLPLRGAGGYLNRHFFGCSSLWWHMQCLHHHHSASNHRCCPPSPSISVQCATIIRIKPWTSPYTKYHRESPSICLILGWWNSIFSLDWSHQTYSSTGNFWFLYFPA